MLSIEPGNVVDYGPCECCGGMNRMVSGFVYRDGAPYAGYQVHWTVGQVAKHGAEFYVILGEWGEEVTAAGRVGVAVHYFIEAGEPGLMVVDAGETSIASNPLVGKALMRAEVIGTPLADEVFEVLDAIAAQDKRVEEVRSASD
jgi:hypothetical protein